MRFTSRLLLLIAVTLAATGVAFGSGFMIPEQGAKASSMAGAFAATADDPSAMFFNVAGIAQLRQPQMTGGADFITFDNQFIGDPNDEFSAGTTGVYKRHLFVVPNGYAVLPVGDSLTVGIGMFSAFGLRTNWDDPWIGRFSSRDANLKTVSLQPSIAWRSASERIMLGAGVEYRRLKVILDSNLPLSGSGVNPFTGRIVDIANAHLESEWGSSIGFTVGGLFRVSENIRIGASYRAPMEIELNGDADFTQISTGNPQIDALVATQLPPDQRIGVDFPFPGITTIGISCTALENWTFDLDVQQTTWSEFDTLVVEFETTPAANLVRPQNWEDTITVRLGANHRVNDTWDVRLGFFVDENPQPIESVSPLLPDADRTGATFGVGYRRGPWTVDAGLMFLDFKDRSTEGRSPDLNGTYETNATLLFANFGTRF